MASRGSLAVATAGVLSLVLGLVFTLVLAARADDPVLGPEIVITGTTSTAGDGGTAPRPSPKSQKTTKQDTDTVSPVQPPPPVQGDDDDDGEDDDD